MFASFDESSTRQANSYLLREIVDPSVVVGLVPYINDPNPRVRDNVIYNMLVNQQVSAIPLVSDLVRDSSKNGGSNDSLRALSNLTVPQAIPYLNPLLFGSNQYVRLSAIQPLGRFSYKAVNNSIPFDRSSIPYLLIALRDPESQKIVAQSAYGILHDMNPKLGLARGDSYFYTARQAETKKLLDWWRDELSGKHPRELMPGESAPIAKTLPANLDAMTKADAVAALNPLLFEMSAYTRRRTIDQLQTRADATSIPYLLLACEDPNFDIAYKAYTTLHRVLPKTGAVVERKAFVADRDTAMKPLYAWWQDELLEKHLPPTPPTPPRYTNVKTVR